ncbi:MAG: protein kinase domain-containing protein [Christensenellales bacterium]
METRLIGKIISRRFRVEDIIGRGGMAIVYRAFDLKTHQTVAIKVLREEYAEDPEYKERFRREGEVCRKLSHPNVVNLIDAGEVGDVSYLAMEYVDGQTLKELITQTGGIAQEDAVRFTLQILAALGHAHQRGIIHRDVKPQNVMVSRAGQVKVGDFGIAGMADTKTLTTDGNVMGSVHYFSPEQAKGMRATEASDLYSVGVILYEMLCGHVPFEGETAVSVAMMHLMEPPKPIEEQAKVSPAVAMIVAKSLQKLPQQRYQSADAMARDLRRALRHPDGGFMDHPAIIEESHEVVEIRKKKSPAACPRVADVVYSVGIDRLIGVAGIRLYRTMFVTIRMPDLAGLDETTARRMVANAGLTLDVEYAYSDLAEGYVCDQTPKANEEVGRGSAVTATVSRGSGLLLVPRLTGMTQTDAENVLIAQGLSLGYVEIVPSEKLRGVVLAQSPEAGENAEPGAAVSLTVSGGRVIVPELVGQREEEAVEADGFVG